MVFGDVFSSEFVIKKTAETYVSVHNEDTTHGDTFELTTVVETTEVVATVCDQQHIPATHQSTVRRQLRTNHLHFATTEVDRPSLCPASELDGGILIGNV